MREPRDEIEDGLEALDCVCDLLVQADGGRKGLEFVAPGRLASLIALIAGRMRDGLDRCDRPVRCDQPVRYDQPVRCDQPGAGA